MTTLNEHLATSLAQLRHLQKGGRRVFRSSELTRTHRERLLRSGFLRSIMKGWLILSSPDTDVNDATSWFASFWEFCECYATKRFGSQWHLSPAQSLLLHAENTVVPSQVIVYSPGGTNNVVTLPFRTSLYDLREDSLPAPADLTIRRGLRLLTAEAALIRVPPSLFTHHPVEMQVVLASISDVSVILHRLLAGGHSVVAGRLSGTFRRIGRSDLSGEILQSMKGAGYNVRETDPFEPGQTFGEAGSVVTPIVGRLHALWKTYREVIVEWSPNPPGLPKDPQGYLRTVDDLYRRDAYHSLSIEGYAVTPQLIDRVRTGQWDPDSYSTDHRNRDASAARGYWQAFQLVRAAISEVIAGGNACRAIRSNHRDWYRQLFEPCVHAGLMDASMLAGYRNTAVYLRASRHIPPGWRAVQDAMPAFFHLLEREPDPFIQAVLGHWLFGYIHPFPDGNGRMARFVMNVLLASGGYPWTVIRTDERDAYLSVLESASIDQDIEPFARFVARKMI